MKLNLIERFTLVDLIPKKSDYIMLKQYRNLREKLGLNPEEVKQFSVKLQGENMTWDNSIDTSKEIKITEIEHDILSKEIRKLDESKILEEKHFTLYNKFINK